jgi:hypothetical protein
MHSQCLNPWLAEKNTCPSCRYELETGDAQLDADIRTRRAEREKTATKRTASALTGANSAPSESGEKASKKACTSDSKEDSTVKPAASSTSVVASSNYAQTSVVASPATLASASSLPTPKTASS